jgi:hypothetical protein
MLLSTREFAASQCTAAAHVTAWGDSGREGLKINIYVYTAKNTKGKGAIRG